MGLSPEQIAQQLAVEQGDERLRQQSVASLVGGYQEMPTMDLRQAQAEHLGAQTGALQATTPGLSAAQQAIIDYHNQQTAASKAQVALALGASPGNIAHTQAQTEALRSQTRAQDFLGQLPAQRIQAEIDKLKESRGTYTDMELPDGSKVRVTGAQLLEAQTATANRDRATQAHRDLLDKQRYELGQAQEAKTEKRLETAAENEAIILGTDPKTGANAEKPAVQANADLFNANSEKDYIYHIDPTGKKNWLFPNAPAMTTLKIPPVNIQGQRVQMTARRVAAQAAKLNMTPEQYIQQILIPISVK